MMLSDVCLSRTSGLSRKQVKRSRSPDRFTHRGVAFTHQAAAAVKVFTVGTYCYVAICRRGGRLGGVSAPTAGGKRRGISWRPPTYTLLYVFVLTDNDEKYIVFVCCTLFTDVCMYITQKTVYFNCASICVCKTCMIDTSYLA